MSDGSPVSQQKIAEIIADMKHVGGWFTADEAKFMAEMLVYALGKPGSYNVVEIGSYQGRSTVVLANIVKLVSPESKVWCIDPFEGKVARNRRPLSPTLETFKANIHSRGLERWVFPVQKRSTDVKWRKKIQFLFIDALHDYDSVVEDFNHFRRFVNGDGFVCFHDRLCFDGVIRATNEFVKAGAIHPVGQSGSLFASAMKPAEEHEGVPRRGIPEMAPLDRFVE